MKYPDEWSGTSVRLAGAAALIVVGLFNVFVWFDEAESPPLWWLVSPIVMVAFGSTAILVWYWRGRNTPKDKG